MKYSQPETNLKNFTTEIIAHKRTKLHPPMGSLRVGSKYFQSNQFYSFIKSGKPKIKNNEIFLYPCIKCGCEGTIKRRKLDQSKTNKVGYQIMCSGCGYETQLLETWGLAQDCWAYNITIEQGEEEQLNESKIKSIKKMLETDLHLGSIARIFNVKLSDIVLIKEELIWEYI